MQPGEQRTDLGGKGVKDMNLTMLRLSLPSSLFLEIQSSRPRVHFKERNPSVSTRRLFALRDEDMESG